jgi:hypothetical protein
MGNSANWREISIALKIAPANDFEYCMSDLDL